MDDDMDDPFAGMDEDKAQQARLLQASLDGNYSLSQRLRSIKEERCLNPTQESDLRTAQASCERNLQGRPPRHIEHIQQVDGVPPRDRRVPLIREG